LLSLVPDELCLLEPPDVLLLLEPPDVLCLLEPPELLLLLLLLLPPLFEDERFVRLEELEELFRPLRFDFASAT
jgi:hypothetical protein